MCQPKEKGGRRCPTHQPASIGIKKFMNAQYGMLPEQIEHTFKTLRSQAKNHPDPTMEEYEHLIARNKTKLENSSVDEKTKRSINRQLDKELSESELPDGATFYALKKLQARTRDQKREFVQMIRELAQHRGTNRNEALCAFKAAYAENEEQYDNDARDDFDTKTRAVLNTLMDREGITSTGLPQFSPYARIERQPVESTWIASMGYDPDDGRLELETQAGRVYAYQGVSQELYERALEDHGTLRREIIHNPRYAYENREAAERDSVGRYCEDCHKYKAIRGHICEGLNTSRLPADVAEATENMETVDSSTMTYEDAVARLRQQLQEAAANDVAPEVVPLRPNVQTAKKAAWAVPVEDREVQVIDPKMNNRRIRGAGGFRIPSASSLEEAVLDEGKVVKFQVTSLRDGEGYEVPEGFEPGILSVDVMVHADETGQLQFDVSDRKCNCDAYKVNGRCPHLIHSRFLSDWDYYQSSDFVWENCESSDDWEVELGINNLHRQISPTSFARSESANCSSVAVSIGPQGEGVARNYDGMSSDNTLDADEWEKAREVINRGADVRVPIRRLKLAGENDLTAGAVTLGEKDGEYVVKDVSIPPYYCSICRSRPCRHGDQIGKFALAGIQGLQKEGDRDYTVLSTSERLSELDEAMRNTWAANQDDAAEMNKFAFPSGVDRSYSANLDQYIADVREAEARIKRGESPIPFVMENATNGVCAPGSGRGFGVELEYSISSDHDKQEVQNAIAKDLYDAGLSDIDYATDYHEYGGSRWHIEDDCSVSGEVVSPILQDSPEHWQELQQVLEIIKRHGGKSSKDTGGHVHMGLGRGEPAEIERRKIGATQIYAAYEDTIRRVQTDPNRKKHRDTEYCAPVGDSAQSSIYELRNDGYLEADHYTSLNLGHEGRIEFRGADGSLDLAHIQAQVVVAAGIVSAAERGELEGETLKQSKIGASAKKMKLLTRGERTKPQTDEELIVSDIEVRRFADDILGTEHGRKIMAGIAANTPWQETRY